MRHFNKLERGVVMMVLTTVWVLTDLSFPINKTTPQNSRKTQTLVCIFLTNLPSIEYSFHHYYY